MRGSFSYTLTLLFFGLTGERGSQEQTDITSGEQELLEEKEQTNVGREMVVWGEGSSCVLLCTPEALQ